MQTFMDWLERRPLVTALLRLLENAAFFDKAGYNRLFDSELRSTLHRVSNGKAREEAMSLLGWDWVNYIQSSLKSAGFKDQNELQEHLQSIVVKLLVHPGKLFRGWQPNTHGPLVNRFKNSTWNAIRNIVEKEQARRRNLPSQSIRTAFGAGDIMASHLAARRPGSHEVIEQFRDLVRRNLGQVAGAVLDQRLSGGETKELIGSPHLGSPSRHHIKEAVRAIKQLAQQFAQQTGNTEFLRMIERAMEQEAATVQKRQRAMAGKLPSSQVA